MARTGKVQLTAKIVKLEVRHDYSAYQMGVEPLATYVELEVPESEVVRKEEDGTVVLTGRGAAQIMTLLMDQIEDANQARTQERVNRVTRSKRQ